MSLLTKWSVREIQVAIARSFHNDRELLAPNISWGFFKQKGMEADLLRLHSGWLDEFEIKRSKEDFLADFKKRVFHSDVRILNLIYVLPEALAGEWLKRYCAEHYKEFKRAFKFLFYNEENCDIVLPVWNNGKCADERFDSLQYMTQDMTEWINEHDVDFPYRRKLFMEEERELFRLVVIRYWEREREAFSIKRRTCVKEETQVIPIDDEKQNKEEKL